MADLLDEDRLLPRSNNLELGDHIIEVHLCITSHNISTVSVSVCQFVNPVNNFEISTFTGLNGC